MGSQESDTSERLSTAQHIICDALPPNPNLNPWMFTLMCAQGTGRQQEDGSSTPSAPWGPRPFTDQSASMPDLQPWECPAFIHGHGKASTPLKAPGSLGGHGNGTNQQLSTLS